MTLGDLYAQLQGQADEQAVQVTVSTMHAAKGRQWPGVVIYEPYEVDISRMQEQQRAEEQRLRYVALTRSTRSLVALLHTQPFPAYERAFGADLMTDLTYLERILTEEYSSEEDLAWLRRTATRYPTLLAYLARYGSEHLPAGVCRALGLNILEEVKPLLQVQRRPLL